MKIFELRGFLKERRIRGFSTLKKTELEAKVQEIKEKEKAEKYEENLRDTAVCTACLCEQRIQRKIDEKTHDQRLLERLSESIYRDQIDQIETIRILFCDFCKHTDLVQNGDDTFCVLCGALQDPNAVGGYRN